MQHQAALANSPLAWLHGTSSEHPLPQLLTACHAEVHDHSPGQACRLQASPGSLAQQRIARWTEQGLALATQSARIPFGNCSSCSIVWTAAARPGGRVQSTGRTLSDKQRPSCRSLKRHSTSKVMLAWTLEKCVHPSGCRCAPAAGRTCSRQLHSLARR